MPPGGQRGALVKFSYVPYEEKFLYTIWDAGISVGMGGEEGVNGP
jgi:hypothetical protein